MSDTLQKIMEERTKEARIRRLGDQLANYVVAELEKYPPAERKLIYKNLLAQNGVELFVQSFFKQHRQSQIEKEISA